MTSAAAAEAAVRGGMTAGAPGRALPGPRRRGHVSLGARTWDRIRMDYEAGAPGPWLAARYGCGVRTLYARAAKEGWRRRDLAERVDRELEAAEDAGRLTARPEPALGRPWEEDAAARAAVAAEGAAGRDRAVDEALDRAVLAMRENKAAEALLWTRVAAAFQGGLAEALRGAAGEAGEAGEASAGAAARAAALAFLREQLGLEAEEAEAAA